MGTKTLYNIIDSIHVSKIRLSRYPLPELDNSPWTRQQQQLFYKLMIEYGTDLGLIQSFFPTRTRNQIKRKYRNIYERKKRALEKMEQRRIRESRKSYFDQQILEQKLIKWPSKPNNQGNSNSETQI